MQKLRRNRQITTVDIQFLEKVIVEAGYGTAEDVERVAADHQGFGLFLRSLIGLDRETAKAAFDQFQARRNLSPRQLDFINMTIDHLAKNGIIDVGLLYEQPFTRLAPGGPETIFEIDDVDTIVTVLGAVRATAVPA